MITLLLIATTVLTVYTAAMFMIFRKVPESYSETFYSLNKIRNNLGFLFPVTIFIVAVTAMPVWFEVGIPLNLILHS